MARTHQKVRLRVWHDDDTVIDLSDRILSGPNLSCDIDMADWDCSIILDNDIYFVNGDLSLDPIDQLSTLNVQGDSEYDPILSENHVVQIEIDSGAGWVVAFDGFAGGNVDSVAVNTQNGTVTFSPDGVVMPIKEHDRLQEITYTDRDLATSLLGSILEDSGFTGRLSHVLIENDPVCQITSYTTRVGSTFNALQEAIVKTGYVLASKYWSASTAYADGSGESTPADGFYLTLYDPQRLKVDADHVFSGVATSRNVRYGIDDTRSWVEVAFENDRGGQQITQPTVSTTGRDRFGIPKGDGTKMYRKMRIVEGNNSPIRTLADAIVYRDFAAHDLEFPIPDTEIDTDGLYLAPVLHDMVEFVFADYTVIVGVSGISHTLDPSIPWGETIIKGTVNRVIGLRNYWLGRTLTEEELLKRRNEFLTGGNTKLAKPVVLHKRVYSKQGQDGEIYGAMDVQWERVDAWWYGRTDIFISIGNKNHFGNDPFMSVRGVQATVQPLPAGEDVWCKLRHVPINQMSPQGRN